MLQSLRSRSLMAGAALSLMALPSVADERPAGGPPGEKAAWSITVGGGGLWSPDYQGSDDHEFRALPYVSVTYEDWLTLSVPEGLKVSVFNEKGFRAGVLAGYRFDREAKDNIALAGWGDIDSTIELGGFVEYRAHWLRLTGEVRQGLSEDTGLLASLSARYETRVGPARVSIGPQVSWGDDDYMHTYFGITPTQAAASVVGLPTYTAEGGVRAYGIGLSVVTPITGNWAVTTIANVNQLTDDAADSPIVATYGSDLQYNAGVFLGYRF